MSNECVLKGKCEKVPPAPLCNRAFRTYSISTPNVYSFAGYRSDLGPICYGCDQQLTTNSCDTITQCGIDEVRTKVLT